MRYIISSLPLQCQPQRLSSILTTMINTNTSYKNNPSIVQTRGENKAEMYKIVLLIVLWCSIFVCNVCVSSSLVNPDVYSLLEFKASLEGTHSKAILSSWSYSSDPCSASSSSWIGITCHGNRVTRLVLEKLNLSGPISPLTRLDQLRLLSLHHNRLHSGGASSVDFSSCTNLKHLYLSFNQLSGPFPAGVPRLRRLRRIDLSHNRFSGVIPAAELGRLPRLVTLRLEGNAFAGGLSGLALPPSVSDFNISGNRFAGLIPESVSAFPVSSFVGNDDLCGRPLPKNCSEKPAKEEPLPVSTGSDQRKQHQKQSKNIVLVMIILSNAIALFLVLVAGYMYCSYRQRRQGKPKERSYRQTQQVQWEEYWVGEKGLQDEDLLQASAEMLGKGSMGTTYKVTPEGGRKVAVVKRVRAIGEKWNRKEVAQILGAIKKLKHKNLVEVQAYYCSREELLIVSDFFPAGSLHFLLHGNRGPGRTPLTWAARLRLATGAAEGLAFLHKNRCVHGHLTSANILVDGDGEARLSDFGLHQLPPATEKADVYDFGALLLELLTGKAAGEDEPARWVGTVAGEALDLELMVGSKEVETEMAAVLQVGLLCLAHKVHERPTMSLVSKTLEDIRSRGEPIRSRDGPSLPGP